MVIYFFFFVWILLFAIFPELQKNKYLRRALFICLGVFLCTGYMVGSDWRDYEYYYGRDIIHGERTEFEIGYTMITKILSSIGVDFWHFHILTKAFCYYTIIKFLQKYTNGQFAWALLFFYSYLSLQYFIDCPFRTLIAASVFLYGIDALFNNKVKLFIVFTLLAASFHLSVLLFAPLLWLLSRKDSFMKKIYFLYLCVGLYILFAFLIQIDQLIDIQIFLSLILGDAKDLKYLFQEGNHFSIGMVTISVFYLACIYCIDTSSRQSNKANLYNTSILYYGFYISLYFIPMAYRLSLYAFMPFICILSKGIISLNNKNKSIAIVTVLLFTVFLGNTLFNNITKDYRYIPYSSYLEYIGGDKPTYSERDSYNKIHSPYRDKGGDVIEYRN